MVDNIKVISNRKINKKNILNIIKNEGPISRVDIAKMLRISRPTVNSYIHELLSKNMIKETGYKPTTPKGGKKAILLSFNKNYKYIFSIILGIGKLTFAVTDLNFSILKKVVIPKCKKSDPNETIKIIGNQILKLMNILNLKKGDFIGIGISAPGVVNSEEGIIHTSPNLPGWENVKLKEILENDIGMKVFIDQECRLQALAENYMGSAKNINGFACIKVAKGIGAGIIIDGKILRDREGLVGEVGHTTIDFKSKKRCACGNFGCLETLCSMDVLVDNIKKELQKKNKKSILKYKDDLNLDKICFAFNKGDKLVVEKVLENAKYLSFGISHIIKFFNPEKIILYGIECFGEKYLKMVKKCVRKETFPNFSKDYNIEFSKLGKGFDLIGSSIMVFNKVFLLKGENLLDRFIVKKLN